MPNEIIKKAIASRTGDGSSSKEIAGAVGRALSLLRLELTSVLGKQAAGALCAHAFHRTRTIVDWTMPSVSELTDGTIATLETDLTARTPEHALHAGETLLFALAEHLVSLIGSALTQRLFLSALGSFGASTAPQEKKND